MGYDSKEPFPLKTMPRGLPRPVVDKMPVPYDSKIDTGYVRWGEEDGKHGRRGRRQEVRLFAKCAVCGEVCPPDDRWGFHNLLMTGCPLHYKCAKIAAAHCPELREKTQDHRALLHSKDRSLPVSRVRRRATSRKAWPEWEYVR